MNWQEIARQASVLLMSLLPYLVFKFGEKASEEIGKRFGGDVWANAEALYQAVRRKFSGDAKAEKVLEEAVEHPESETHRAALAEELREKAEADPEFGQQIAHLTEITVQNDEVAHFITQIYGGRVTKLVNIGQADKVEF